MRRTYDLKTVNGYLIADMDGEQCLIDTGAPSTVTDSYCGMSLADISQMVGCHVDVILGGDDVREVWFNVSAGLVSLCESRKGCLAYQGGFLHPQLLTVKHDCSPAATFVQDSWKLDIDSFHMGLPIVEIEVDGELLRLIFDSGSPWTRIPGKYLDGVAGSKTITEFHPTTGEYELDVVRKELIVGGESMPLMCGETTDEITDLVPDNVHGLLGSEILMSDSFIYIYSARRRSLYRFKEFSNRHQSAPMPGSVDEMGFVQGREMQMTSIGGVPLDATLA